jgi:hypothetical protein
MWRGGKGKPLPFRNRRRRLYPICKREGLTAPASAATAKAPSAATTRASLTRLKAVLAVHGTVAPGLKWNGGLLSASGADHRCTPRFTAVAAATAAGLFVLLGLTAGLAALGRRITTFAEEVLILSGKRECLPAIAAHKLLIFSHISLSSMLQLSATFNVSSRSLTITTDPLQSPLNSINEFPAFATPNESGPELPVRRSAQYLEQARDSEDFIVTGVVLILGIKNCKTAAGD